MYFGINRPRNSRTEPKRKRNLKRRSLTNVIQLSLLFVPGALFVLMGVCAFMAPQLLVLAIASFFLFVGFACCIVAWKFVQFKHRFDNLVRNFEARLVVQNAGPVQYVEDDPGLEMKKIVLH